MHQVAQGLNKQNLKVLKRMENLQPLWAILRCLTALCLKTFSLCFIGIPFAASCDYCFLFSCISLRRICLCLLRFSFFPGSPRLILMPLTLLLSRLNKSSSHFLLACLVLQPLNHLSDTIAGLCRSLCCWESLYWDT